jgi:hypothetical protein
MNGFRLTAPRAQRILLILLALSLALPLRSQAAAQESSATTNTIRILFIGNSYTYFNNLPAILNGLATAAAAPKRLITDRVTMGGATLKKHWEDQKALEAIRRSRWDYVVLQEQSTLGPSPMINGIPQINDPKTFYEYARLFDHEIRKAGARTIFYMTWARQNAPDSQPTLAVAYQSIAHELNAILVPAGLAWQHALKEKPEFELHVADKSHPSPRGSYLAACVFYAVLFEKSPEGLPGLIRGISLDTSGKAVAETENVLVNLPAAESAALQRIAWQTARESHKK